MKFCSGLGATVVLSTLFAIVTADPDEGYNPKNPLDKFGYDWDNILQKMRDQNNCMGRPVDSAKFGEINLHTCSAKHGRGVYVNSYPCLFRCLMKGMGWLDSNWERVDTETAIENGLKVGVFDEGQVRAMAARADRDGCLKMLPQKGANDCTKYTKGLECIVRSMVKTCSTP